VACLLILSAAFSAALQFGSLSLKAVLEFSKVSYYFDSGPDGWHLVFRTPNEGVHVILQNFIQPWLEVEIPRTAFVKLNFSTDFLYLGTKVSIVSFLRLAVFPALSEEVPGH
jgi:hypothetical protein